MQVGHELLLVDTHCHLDWRAFDDDREAMIQRAVEAGVTRMVTIGVDVESSRRAVDLAERHASVYAAVGVHPNDANDFDAETLNAIRDLAAHPKVVAIGEIGLDNYWKKVEPGIQARAFETQLDLAAELGKPVIIHNREATAEVMTILERHAARGVWHSFSASLDIARRAFELGFIIGFSGPVTFKKSNALREVVRMIPPERFVIETDAPFLTPEPNRGRRNEPAAVRHIAERIARERGETLERLAEQTTANAECLFGWKKAYGSASY